MKKFLIYLSSILILFGVSVAFAGVYTEDFEDGDLDWPWSIHTMGPYEIVDGELHVDEGSIGDGLARFVVGSDEFEELIYRFEADINVSSSEDQGVGLHLELREPTGVHWHIDLNIYSNIYTNSPEIVAGLYNSVPAVGEVLGTANLDEMISLAITLHDNYITFGVNGNKTDLFEGIFQKPSSVSESSVYIKAQADLPNDIEFSADNLVFYSSSGAAMEEIIGTWSSGIWYWDVAASNWAQMTSFTPTGDIAAGDFTGDGKADVASVWSNGLWYQDGATLTWIIIDSSPPNSVTAGDVTGDGRDEIIGTWSSGIWYWDVAASNWAQMTSFTPTGDIAAGDFTGDGKADVASVWSNGLWYQDGATLTWIIIDSSPPNSVTAGDVTGDGRDEIIGTWSSGIWYWDVAASNWAQMTSFTPTGDIAAGDFTGDGKADVASVWSDGLWYQDGDTLGWTKVSDSAPDSVTCGNVTGN